MALPTTITVTDSGGAHAITIPAGYAIAEIKCIPIVKTGHADCQTLEVNIGDGRRRSFNHRDVTGITVA